MTDAEAATTCAYVAQRYDDSTPEFSAGVRQRCAELLAGGNYGRIKWGPIAPRIEGAFVYSVLVPGSHGDRYTVEYCAEMKHLACDCHYGSHGGRCKHQYAALVWLGIVERPEGRAPMSRAG